MRVRRILPLFRPLRRPALATLLGALAALLPFFAILWWGLPAWFPGWITEDVLSPHPVHIFRALPARQLWSLAVALATVGAFSLRGALGRWLPLALLLAALAAAQASIWQTGLSRYTMIGGLIPYSDAGVYTEYANQIAQGHQVEYALQDRPMFSCLLASLLLLCRFHLQCALALLLLLAGVSLYLAMRSIRVRFGAVVCIVFVWVILLFYTRWIGSTMTEHLGLILGLLACPFLLAGWTQERRKAWLAGITLLTLALCARAGAFFVLPALVALTLFRFRSERHLAWKHAGQALGAIVAVLLLSRFLAFCVFASANFPESNFDYTAYGVVHGSSWELAFRKYGTNHEKIRAALIKRVKAHPSSVPLGMWRAWRTFFQEAYGFSYMGRNYTILLQAAALFAFVTACWRRRSEDWLVIAIAVGVGASIPFAPPADADTMRVYAATIPLHALLCGLGTKRLFEWLGIFRANRGELVELPSANHMLKVEPLIADSGVAAVVLLATFAVPVLHYVYFPHRGAAQSLRTAGRNPGQLARGTYINLVADTERTRVPNVRVSDLRNHLGNFANTFPKEAAGLTELSPGISIVSGGFDVAMFPTEKLHDPNSVADLRRWDLHWLKVEADKELALPLPFVPAAGQ